MSGTARRGTWSWAIVAVVLAVGGYIVVRDRHALAASFREIGWGAMVASGLFALLGTVMLLGLWLSVLRALGAHVPPGQAWRVFFVSQLGKYIPGLVWPAIVQMEAGHRWGVRRSAMLTANLLMIAVLTSSGVVVGLVFLPGSVGLTGVSGWGAWVGAAVLLVVCLWPRLLTALVDWTFTLARRQPPALVATPREMAVAFTWALAVWCLYGLHVWLLVQGVGGSGADAWKVATGGIALGWALGLVAVFAPAGVGVRDAVLLAVLAPLVGRTPALAVALASRGLLALVDVLLAAVAAIGAGRSPASAGLQE